MAPTNDSGPPRFDVLTITWNNFEGLKRTWESVQEQDFDNWRWLVVDGGSTDGTVEWLSSLSDERVDWQSGPDDGIFDAMNKGIDRSTADIVVFLNAADTFSTAQVLAIVDADQRDRQWAWAYGVMRYVRPDGTVEGIHFTPSFSLNDLRLGLRFIGHQSAFFGRDILDAVKGYKPEYGFAADQEFMYRAAMVQEPAAIPHMLGDFLLGGVSKDVPPDYFVKVARVMRREQHTQVASNDAIDAVVTSALRAGAWGRQWVRQLLRRG
jgi:glycosyltransferase involved in cell wall biosynthesis